jgi:hypothetical protein
VATAVTEAPSSARLRRAFRVIEGCFEVGDGLARSEIPEEVGRVDAHVEVFDLAAPEATPEFEFHQSAPHHWEA